MARSIQRFLANNYMEILLVTWYILHLPLLFLFIAFKVGYYYFGALILISSGIYHLVKRNGNRKSLATYYAFAILGYLFIITLILNLKHPEPVLSTEQNARWLIAGKSQI